MHEIEQLVCIIGQKPQPDTEDNSAKNTCIHPFSGSVSSSIRTLMQSLQLHYHTRRNFVWSKLVEHSLFQAILPERETIINYSNCTTST